MFESNSVPPIWSSATKPRVTIASVVTGTRRRTASPPAMTTRIAAVAARLRAGQRREREQLDQRLGEQQRGEPGVERPGRERADARDQSAEGLHAGTTLTRARRRFVLRPDDPGVIPEDEAGSSIRLHRIVMQADDTEAARRESSGA